MTLKSVFGVRIWEMALFSVLTTHRHTLTTCVYLDLKDLLFCTEMGLLSSTKILLWPMMSRPERTVHIAVKRFSQPIFFFSSKIFINYAKYRLLCSLPSWGVSVAFYSTVKLVYKKQLDSEQVGNGEL